jgi:hypothetical protein
MSGIIQKKSTPSGIESPVAGSVFMGIDDSGVFYTKNESGTVTTYPTTSGGGTFTGGTVSFLSATTLSSTTLNIDFTDTLDTVMGQVDYIASFESDGRLQGDFIGQTYRDGDLFGYIGLLDGIANIGGGAFELPVNQWVANFIDEDNEVAIGAAYGFIDFTPFDGGSQGVQVVPLKLEVPGHLVEIGAFVNPVTQSYQFDIFKESPNGAVYIGTNKNQTQFEVSTDLDDEEEVFEFSDNNGDGLLTILGQFIKSQNILDNRNYADDATAAADDVPEGAFYHTDGVLKIRRPLP